MEWGGEWWVKIPSKIAWGGYALYALEKQPNGA